MTVKTLPHDTLILNGHKIYTTDDLFRYITKRLCLTQPMTTIEQLQEYRTQYHITVIKIWHPDTFLKDEPTDHKTYLLSYLQNHTIN